MESIDLIPMDGDVSKITRRAEEFRDLPEALQRNLQTFLTLTMDALAGVHQKIKGSFVADANKQIVSRFPSVRCLATFSPSVCFVSLRHWLLSRKNRDP